MAIKTRVAFKTKMPFATEHKLCHLRGFHVHARSNDLLILQKGWPDKVEPTDPPPPWDQNMATYSHTHPTGEPMTVDEIPEWRVRELTRRCMKIYDCFVEPNSFSKAIRGQIAAMAKREHLTDVELEWIENWIYNNVL